MNHSNTNTAVKRDNSADKPQTYRKRVGSTVYVVTVHFSNTSRETAEDKLLRLIKREVENHA